MRANQKRFTNFLCMVVIFYFCFGVLTGAEKEDNKWWIGHIVIKHTLSQSYEKKKSTVSRKSYSKLNHKLNDSVRILFCVKDAKVCILDVNRLLDHSYESKGSRQNTKEICPLTEEQMKHNFLYRVKHFKQDVKKPGDHNKTTTTYERGVYGDPTKDQAGIHLVIYPGGHYSLQAFSSCYVDYTYDSINESYDACSGNTKTYETQITTGQIGDEPSGSINENSIISVMPPLKSTLGVVYQGEVEGNKISGFKIMTDKKPEKSTDKTEKYVAYWELRYTDPTHYAIDCYTFAKESLGRALKSCFKELNLPDGDCDQAKLYECCINSFNMDLKPLDFSDCIDAWCGYTGNVNPSPELKEKLHQSVTRALQEYHDLLEDCYLYGSCDNCEDY